MSTKGLKKIIENHKHWLNEDCEGWENMKADLSGADLSGADLCGADLSDADLSDADLIGADLIGADLCDADLLRADLRGADLIGANLRGADLSGADLSGAGLSGADLSSADLIGANLSGADLNGADLSGADLSGADLSGADLSDADLSSADLIGANLSGADLRDADLRWADLSRAKNVPFIPMACPDTGSFTAYKKTSGKIIKLLIPKEARRSSATGRKCRCDKAVVMEIQNLDGTKADVDHVSSSHDKSFVYTVGETVCVTDFCTDRFEECAAGIHFFINRQEAVEYSE